MGRWVRLKRHVWPTALARREERKQQHAMQADTVQRNGPEALIGQRPDITNQARPAHGTAGAEHAEEGERDTINRVQQCPRPREAVCSGKASGRWVWLESYV